MRHTHRDEQEKMVRRMYTEYMDLIKDRNASGHWEEVEPYQKGWVRYYVLGKPVRMDRRANLYARALDCVNYQIYSGDGSFTRPIYRKGRKTKMRESIPQPLKHLTEAQYYVLDDELKPFFVHSTWTERRTYPTVHYVTISGYVLKAPNVYVLHVEPNIVTHHFIPDGEWESRCAELRKKIYRDNLWPKINKALSKSMHNGHRFDSPKYVRTKQGFEVELWDGET